MTLHSQFVRLGVVLAATLACSCHVVEEPHAPADTTSAAYEPAISKADFDRTVLERDQAREAIREQAARHEQERRRLEAELDARKEHDDLSAKAWVTINMAESELKAMKEKAARASIRERQKIEASIENTKARVSNVETHLREIPPAVGDAWPPVRKSLETAIDDLDRAVRDAVK